MPTVRRHLSNSMVCRKANILLNNHSMRMLPSPFLAFPPQAADRLTLQQPTSSIRILSFAAATTTIWLQSTSFTASVRLRTPSTCSSCPWTTYVSISHSPHQVPSLIIYQHFPLVRTSTITEVMPRARPLLRLSKHRPSATALRATTLSNTRTALVVARHCSSESTTLVKRVN